MTGISIMEQLLKENDNKLLISPRVIDQIALLGAKLTRLANECKTQCVIIRSQEKRRKNIIKDGKIGNPDAVFNQECKTAKEALTATMHEADMALADFDLRLGYDWRLECIADFVQFCKEHQLDRENGWNCELTNDELDGIIKS